MAELNMDGIDHERIANILEHIGYSKNLKSDGGHAGGVCLVSR